MLTDAMGRYKQILIDPSVIVELLKPFTQPSGYFQYLTVDRSLPPDTRLVEVRYDRLHQAVALIVESEAFEPVSFANPPIADALAICMHRFEAPLTPAEA